MSHIPIIVKTVSEVVSDASLERELTNKVITSCSNCGGIYFYHIVHHMGKGATDNVLYCAQCGQQCLGIVLDPFDELDEQMNLKKERVDTINEEE